MSLFMLTEKDMSRRPTLISFDWHNRIGNLYKSGWRNWRAILRISKLNLWALLVVNIAMITTLAWAAVLLMTKVKTDGVILIFVGLVTLLTVLYVPNIIKLGNYLLGGGRRG